MKKILVLLLLTVLMTGMLSGLAFASSEEAVTIILTAKRSNSQMLSRSIPAAGYWSRYVAFLKRWV